MRKLKPLVFTRPDHALYEGCISAQAAVAAWKAQSQVSDWLVRQVAFRITDRLTEER